MDELPVERSAEQQRLHDQVFASRMRPSEAEAIAADRGWPAYASISHPWEYVARRTMWSPTFVLMWLSCRSQEEAAIQWNRLAVWKHAVHRDLPDHYHVRQIDLIKALTDGELVAHGKRSADAVDYVEIPQLAWEDGLSWNTAMMFPTASRSLDRVEWFDVRILRVDVEGWADGRPAIRAAAVAIGEPAKAWAAEDLPAPDQKASPTSQPAPLPENRSVGAGSAVRDAIETLMEEYLNGGKTVDELNKIKWAALSAEFPTINPRTGNPPSEKTHDDARKRVVKRWVGRPT